MKHCSHSGGALYGIGIVGAIVYYLRFATTFGGVIVAIFKGIFWPAFLVFKVFMLLKM